MRDFIQACNGEQVRHAPQACKFICTQSFRIDSMEIIWIAYFQDADLCHLFTNYIIKSGIPPIQGLKVLAQAVDKIRLFDSQLTPVHADLFQLSLCAKVFNPALKFLDVDITAISTTDVSKTQITLYL